MLKSTKNIERSIKRKNLVECGVYDGRYRQRVVQDKKKELSKTWARIKSSNYTSI